MFRRSRQPTTSAFQAPAPSAEQEKAPVLVTAPSSYAEPDASKLIGELLQRPTLEGLLESALHQAAARLGNDVKGYAVLKRERDRVVATLQYPRSLLGLHLSGPWSASRARLTTEGSAELYKLNPEELHPQLDAAGMRDVKFSLVLPLSDRGRNLGALVLDRLSGPFGTAEQESGLRLASVVGPLLGLVDGREESRDIARTIASSVVEAMESVDFDSVGHAYQVADLAARLGRAVGLSGRELEELWFAATLHDIGKVQGEEGHAQVGANLLHGLSSMQQVQLAIRHHHERWDGEGTPDQLAGADIPLYARILTVANAYVRTGDMDVMRSQAGRALEPRLVDMLEKIVERQAASAD